MLVSSDWEDIYADNPGHVLNAAGGPRGGPWSIFVERDGEYEIAFGDRRYVLPESDVAALPIDNSTAERLAEWLNVRIRAVLSASGASNVGRVTVGVEEAPGQAGWFASDGPEG